jgi:hypothetical protein
VDGAVTIEDNRDYKAQAATLTIDTGAGGELTIERGGELEITAETNTPTSTRRYDEKTWLMAHNAHTALEYNVIYAQQSGSLTSQLEDGVHALMIDVHDWGGVNDRDLYLCHGSEPSLCTIPFLNPNTLPVGSAAAAIATILAQVAACGLTGGATCASAAATLASYVGVDSAARMKLSDGLDEVKDFLDDNPDAIVTLIIEDVEASSEEINNRFEDAGLANYMYDPGVDAPNGTTGCWPSLDWMMANNKRLVVFMQDAGADLEGRVLGQFAYTVENTFDIGVGESNYDPTCTNRGSSAALDDRSRKLFVMNHFASITLPTEFTPFSDFDSPLDGIDFDGSGSPNDYDRLLDRVDGECFAASQRYPNFLAVDFYGSPSYGPDDVVAELNARWQPDGGGYNVPGGSATASPIAANIAPGTNVASIETVVAETAVAGKASTDNEASPGNGVVPEQLTLGNYPNPFNPVTRIMFTLPETAHVTLVVYDVVGRAVKRLVNETRPAGTHTVRFDAPHLPSGVYFYRLETEKRVLTRQMVLLK